MRSVILIVNNGDPDTESVKQIRAVATNAPFPDKSYLKKHNFDASHNYLHKMDPDFSGYLEYLTIEGERTAIVRVVNGRPVRKYAGKGASAPKQQRPVLKSGGMMAPMGWEYECMEICEEIWGEMCFPALDPDDPDGWDCYDQLIDITCYEECDWVEYPDDPEDPEDPEDPDCWTMSGFDLATFSDCDEGPEPEEPVSIHDVHNDLSNLCLKNLLNEMVNNGNLTSKMAQILQDFNLNNNIAVKYADGGNLPPHMDGHFNPASTASTLYIDLNASTLPNASKEFAATVIFHETLHAHLFVSGQADSTHHFNMALQYRGMIADALVDMFGLGQQTADHLAWSGLALDSNSIWQTFKAGNPVEANSILNTLSNHRSGSAGSAMNCSP